MRLTRHTDYALRVLIYLGLRQDRLVSIREIAEGYGISENHLMKVVNELGRLGYVATARGRGGGLRLGRPAKQIPVGEVVRRTEGEMALIECLGAGGACPITESCVLSAAIGEALDAFLAVLDRYTLADLVRPKDSLRRLLSIAESH